MFKFNSIKITSRNWRITKDYQQKANTDEERNSRLIPHISESLAQCSSTGQSPHLLLINLWGPARQPCEQATYGRAIARHKMMLACWILSVSWTLETIHSRTVPCSFHSSFSQPQSPLLTLPPQVACLTATLPAPSLPWPLRSQWPSGKHRCQGTCPTLTPKHSVWHLLCWLNPSPSLTGLWLPHPSSSILYHPSVHTLVYLSSEDSRRIFLNTNLSAELSLFNLKSSYFSGPTEPEMTPWGFAEALLSLFPGPGTGTL